MTELDLTVQVSRLAPKVTPVELVTFFSYCGTVNNIRLSRNKDQSQTALVTFIQPYAFHTALLLNDAVFAGQPIRILPAKDPANPPIPDNRTKEIKKKREKKGFIPALQAEMEAIASKGIEALSKAKEEIDENYKLSEKGRVLVDQTISLVGSAEQAAGHIGAKIVDGAHWFSGEIEKASKRASELGTRKKDNPNSRKQK